MSFTRGRAETPLAISTMEKAADQPPFLVISMAAEPTRPWCNGATGGRFLSALGDLDHLAGK
ncbi:MULTISPECIES: hypothetical protein [Actinomadura]|uniref:Uncharacterized protein n=1 Tax=Actinomadura yumaensis TaxID=111807 RepID=A0ABW2CIB6_9ACTN|nr:hypothetical protein [Actinomadura sp. J1-007]MWK34733.1 hypothetical protein [Actinomadura sp. J1-007]